jgi:transcriptional regulator with XRE-family HTH domain
MHDLLAEALGVSCSILSQIERGEGNATVFTLWNVTQALILE